MIIKTILIISFAVVFLLSLNASFAVADEIPNTRKQRPSSIQRPALIEFHGPIDFKIAKYFDTRLRQARNSKADLLIIEIESPGGLMSESLAIAEKLRDVDWAYTVAFVKREAISGGALVSIGCDESLLLQRQSLVTSERFSLIRKPMRFDWCQPRFSLTWLRPRRRLPNQKVVRQNWLSL